MCSTILRFAEKRLLTALLAGLVAGPLPGCGGISTGGTGGTGGSHPDSGGEADSGDGQGSGGQLGADGAVGADGASGEGVVTGADGATGGGVDSATGESLDGATDRGADASIAGQYVVAMLQSSKGRATDLTQADVAELVTSAVAQAGGLDFVKDGQTVVLKPNLVTVYLDHARTKVMDQTVNGVSTDWRVTKAVADLVRARNPTGKILVMEGSVVPTATAFSLMGYTSANFGNAVDEFIALEGASCSDQSTAAFELRTSVGGLPMWVNRRYIAADVVISLPTMKTHLQAGITGAVKNLGIGTTPVGHYSAVNPDGGAKQDCTRGLTAPYIDHSSAEALGQFIHEYFSIRPADFVVMDGLQGLQNGPASLWAGTSYANDKMNMRLILAGRNAVAVDTIEALVMKCDPTKVPYLTKLEASGFGTTDLSRITVLGKQPSEVARAFAARLTEICPGP